MTLQEKSQFKTNLYNILNELSQHKRQKNELISKYIEQRLNTSISTYYKEITYSLNYFRDKNVDKIIKHL